MILFLEETVPTGFSPASTIFMLIAMIAIFYFMAIRPENKRKKEAETMRNELKVGDKISTIGGIVGTIVSLKDDKLVIETSLDQVRIELHKWAVGTNESQQERKKEQMKKAQEAAAKARAAKKAEKLNKEKK